MQNDSRYPVRYGVRYAEGGLNRLLNLPFFIGTVIKLILALPVVIIVALLTPGSFGSSGSSNEADGLLALVGLATFVLYLIGPVAILFTGKYPEGCTTSWWVSSACRAAWRLTCLR
ncbi:MAG: hypothetical protein GEU28_09050 [Dehalococcoidia bacterium]|nr:hypothetical protein [Dehalococcoidia bacterium]